MIVKPTVLVLGAGASQPYGFPTGPRLARLVCNKLEEAAPASGDTIDTPFSRALLSTYLKQGFSHAFFREFWMAFRYSGCAGLDEFVQPQGNRRFLDLAKAGMIELLVAQEIDQNLAQDDETFHQVDWCTYLFRLMRTAEADLFQHNRVRVITFNFDRSFERRLFLLLRDGYGLSDHDAGATRGAIQVLHLHGRLGGEKWLNENRPESREFAPTASPQQKVELLRSIRIVHQELDIDEVRRAVEWLDEAETICFLGFGYHPLTLGRLNLSEPLPRATIWGTTLGLSAPELTRLRRHFGNKDNSLRLDEARDKNALAYLRNVHVLTTERG